MQRAGYLPQLKKSSSLTDKNYALIGETLRKRYGDHAAGWAFIVLFVAEVCQCGIYPDTLSKRGAPQ
jgi:hypothetical protein